MKFVIHRSAEWIRQQAIIRAANVPAKLEVEVEVSDLSEAVRRILLSPSGTSHPTYPAEVSCVLFNRSYAITGFGPSRFHDYGGRELSIDSDAPSVAEIEACFLAAVQEISDAKAKAEAEEDEREAEKLRLAHENASRAKRLAAARELLKDDLDRLTEARADRATLADFLAAVPQDALRGTLKRLCANDEARRRLEEKVEAASPTKVIFHDEEDEG